MAQTVKLSEAERPAAFSPKDLICGEVAVLVSCPHAGWAAGQLVVRAGDALANLTLKSWTTGQGLCDTRVRHLLPTESVTITRS